ncbi:site-specific integrase [Streptomyces sp. NPDC005395]|uniref:tyrosine-type recombinase/integrase n=1 Tax=unclassified Streptomyces TaxID=2593676 RepID=UPI0018D898DA|nr:site-specific integrase [Streptomyces sp. HB-N217]MBH5131179.1 tyrosine-type recombinase/integrase [Streptomyces sp. HB-N217]
MAGHVQDRWYKVETGTDGKTVKVKTDRFGVGLRYRARYVGPDGSEKSKSFPDRKKREAERWLTNIEADMSRGHYIDPTAGKITFRKYAEDWLASQTTDPATRVAVESRLRLHVFPYLGGRPLASFQPSHIRSWARALEDTGAASSYRRVIFGNVSAVLSAAVDDGYLARNPCRAGSVRPPKPSPGRVTPWSSERVFAVRDGMPDRLRAMVDLGAGCGLRQGEIFGLTVDDVDPLAGVLHVTQQVKLVNGHLIFAPPKNGKLRDVPLPDSVAAVLATHMTAFPPVEVTLPWLRSDGPPVTKLLYFSTPEGGAFRRNDFNTHAWKPALASAGIIPVPGVGERYKESREDGMHALRHFYASVLLDSGESVKALSTYLGHGDPGFTLRTYTHLMPTSETRTRKAVDAVYRKARGRSTAQ